MAQTGYTPILLYSSSTTTNAPAAGNLTNSTFGSELAINIADGKLFYKDPSNNVQVIAWKTTPTTAGGTGLSSYSQGDLLYYNSGTTLTALAKNTSATRYLSNTGSNNNPAWAQIDLTNGVTGTLLVGNGGTGNTTGAATAVKSNATTGLMEIVGPGTGTTRVMTIPNANFTAARTDASQTFTGDQTFTNNIGIDAAPRAWAAGFPALDVGSGAGGGFAANTSAGFVYVTSNAFYNGSSWVRKGADWATLYAAGDGVHYFYTAANSTAGSNISFTETVQFDDVGNVKVANGNVVISTSGKGIDFSATPGTGTSELLNDYEEGNWTPTLTFGGASTGITYDAFTNGIYTRVGNLVTVSCRIGLTNKGSATGGAAINGLPFTVAATPDAANVPITIVNIGITYAGMIQSYVSAGATSFALTECTEAGVFGAITNADFSNSSTILAAVTYRV